MGISGIFGNKNAASVWLAASLLFISRSRAGVACKAHNLEVGGSNPPSATKLKTINVN